MARSWWAGLTSTAAARSATAPTTTTTLAARALCAAGALRPASALRPARALRIHTHCQHCESKDSDDKSACSHETPPRKPVEIKAISFKFKAGSMAQNERLCPINPIRRISIPEAGVRKRQMTPGSASSVAAFTAASSLEPASRRSRIAD
jgi:hypothetical protein